MPNKKKVCPGDPAVWKYCKYCCNFKHVDEFTIKICRPCQVKKNATNTKYAHGDTGKKSRSTYWSSSPGKSLRKKYNASAGGKAARKKWSDSDKGAAYKVVKNQHQSDDYHNKPGHKLNLKLCHVVNAIVKGKRTISSNVKYTGFGSCVNLSNHFKRHCRAAGLKMSDHGSVWWVGHRIPRVYFDHTNMQDVKKCWSKANMFPQLKEDNQKDTIFISKENCAIVGADHFPASWNGAVPLDAEIAVLHAKAHAGKL